MATRNHHHRFLPFPFLVVLSVFICVHLWLQPSSGFAQEEAAQEVAVNLAEGRVVICAAKDGIIVATVDTHSEAGSHPPAVMMMSALRAGVMLGAVEWVQPESKDKPIRLDDEFRGIVAAALNIPAQQNNSGGTTDIEMIGIAVLERLRQLAELLHHKINVGDDEPLLRIVLAGYVVNYGPEAWTIDYHIRQDALGNDYWRTRVLRPTYNQVYPPEKGKPHTLAEVRYPPANRAKDDPELLDLLRQNDPRLAKIRTSNDLLTKSVAFVVDGQSQKSTGATDVEFLKAALPVIAPPQSKFTMALVDFDRGFQWILQLAKTGAKRSRAKCSCNCDPRSEPMQRRRNPKGRHCAASPKTDGSRILARNNRAIISMSSASIVHVKTIWSHNSARCAKKIFPLRTESFGSRSARFLACLIR